jgi:hypothetical protein
VSFIQREPQTREGKQTKKNSEKKRKNLEKCAECQPCSLTNFPDSANKTKVNPQNSATFPHYAGKHSFSAKRNHWQKGKKLFFNDLTEDT